MQLIMVFDRVPHMFRKHMYFQGFLTVPEIHEIRHLFSEISQILRQILNSKGVFNREGFISNVSDVVDLIGF